MNWGAGISYSGDFLENAFSHIPNRKDTVFYVFSDDVEKAKTILSRVKERLVFCEENPDYIDMWMMSLCNHNIICHSTMGWWGAYLNKNKDKKVIYPLDVLRLRRGTFHDKPVCLERMEDFYIKEWIGVKGKSIIQLK